MFKIQLIQSLQQAPIIIELLETWVLLIRTDVTKVKCTHIPKIKHLNSYYIYSYNALDCYCNKKVHKK